MPDTNKLIDKIIFAFDMEMSSIESQNILLESWAGNSPSVAECFRRQNRQGKEYAVSYTHLDVYKRQPSGPVIPTLLC